MRTMLWASVVLSVVGCGGKKDITAYMTSKEHFAYAMKYFNKKNYLKAQEQFSLISYRHSGSEIADDAQFYLAESYFLDKDYVSASSEYDRLVTAFPRSEFVEKALYRLAVSYYELSPHYALDQKFTYDALNAAQNFMDLYRNSEHYADVEKIFKNIRSKLANKDYMNATVYRKISEYEAAIAYYDIVIAEHYESSFVPEARFWKGYCYFRLKEYQKASLTLQRFIDDFPLKKDLVNDALELLEDIRKLTDHGGERGVTVSKGR